MTELAIFYLFGGVCLLLYGVRQTGDGLQNVAGGKLRHILATLTDHKLRAVVVGALATAVLQSSTATTAVLVSFVSSGLMNLTQSIGIILGADIGSTVTVQLIAFKVWDYAILIIGLGLLFVLVSKQKTLQSIGQTIFGFGLIFYSIKIMSDAVSPLGNNELFQTVLRSLTDTPLLLLILAAVFTALVHSSAATIAIALAFAHLNLMPLSGALPIIFGANIGTSATALISSIGNTVEAKRVALAHALFKVFGVIIFYPFSSLFIKLVQHSTSDAARQIANAHTMFNVIIAAIFLALTVPLSKLVTRLIPDTKEQENIFKPKYLDGTMVDTPALGLGLATRETLRMADIVTEMYTASLDLFKVSDEEQIIQIQDQDDKVDLLDREIKLYLTRLSQHGLANDQSQREVMLLTIVNNLENIGDIIDKNLLELAKKRAKKQLTFSEQGWEEITELHGVIQKSLEQTITALATSDIHLAQQVVATKPQISELERNLRQSHISRLQAGLPESLETSEVHLDILTNLKRINSHITGIAYAVIG